MEFEVTADCPFCGHEQTIAVEFDENEFGTHGAQTSAKDRCFECDKDFWFDASIRFDVEIDEIFKKKPKRDERENVHAIECSFYESALKKSEAAEKLFNKKPKRDEREK